MMDSPAMNGSMSSIQTIPATLSPTPIANTPVTPTVTLTITKICSSILKDLEHVPGFHIYLDSSEDSDDKYERLMAILRQGTSLCYLFNQLKDVDKIVVSQSNSLPEANKAKLCVYKFVSEYTKQLCPNSTTIVSDFSPSNENNIKTVKMIEHILDKLKEQEVIPINEPELKDNKPKDTRENVIAELISSESRYLTDLERLQEYRQEVKDKGLIDGESIHNLFGNLNAIVNCTRRFLIAIEKQDRLSARDQRFGKTFLDFEEEFTNIYGPYCTNYETACQISIKEAPQLKPLSHILDPISGLPTRLITPVQRVCRYPLLLQQLIKSTPEDWPWSQEEKQGLEAMQRITTKANEARRVEENNKVSMELRKVIIRHDNTNIAGDIDVAGKLLLHGKFHVKKKDTCKETTVYLYEKVIFICKKISNAGKHSIAYLMKKRTEGTMLVKTRIDTSRIKKIDSIQHGDECILQIVWMDKESTSVNLKCLNEEVRKQWYDAITNLLGKISASNKLNFLSALNAPRMDYDTAEPLPDHFKKNYHSYNYGSYNTNNRYPNEVVSRHKNGSLSVGSTPISHYHNNLNIPELALPPLPGSPTHYAHSNDENHANATLQDPHPHPHHFPQQQSLNIYFPSSPPGSHPSSPTAAADFRSQHSNHGSSSNNSDSGPLSSSWFKLGQSQSNNAGEPSHVRARSQSSPNIQPQQQQQQRPPEMPTIYNPHHQQHRKSSGYKYDVSNYIPVERSPLLQQKHEQSTINPIKVKIHYLNVIYLLLVEPSIGYSNLLNQIIQKIEKSEREATITSLKYRDEDGDYITISSNEDVEMGFETRGSNNNVNIYVSD